MMDKQRIVINQDDLIEVGKHLRMTGTYYVAGSYSISVPSTGQKYMLDRVVKRWPTLEGELIMMLPGEAARTELRRVFPDLKRVGWSGPMVKLLDMRCPMHYGGQSEGQMVLYDLKSAYWQIYKKLWLDTSYPTGYYGKYPLREVAERLAHWKPARNAVVGIARSRKTTGVKGSRRYYLHTTNRYLSPGLWATVQSVLHWVAKWAIHHGAIYVNTDGYIFPKEAGGGSFAALMYYYGFDLEIRAEGEGKINSWNNYAIGKKETKPFRLGLIHKSGVFSNVQREERYEWGAYLQRCSYINKPSPSYQKRGDAKRPSDLYKAHTWQR